MDDRQPRSTGELLSDALSLFRRHFKLLYSLALPFCAVEMIMREAGKSAAKTVSKAPVRIPTTTVDSSYVGRIGKTNDWTARRNATETAAEPVVKVRKPAAKTPLVKVPVAKKVAAKKDAAKTAVKKAAPRKTTSRSK